MRMSASFLLEATDVFKCEVGRFLCLQRGGSRSGMPYGPTCWDAFGVSVLFLFWETQTRGYLVSTKLNV